MRPLAMDFHDTRRRPTWPSVLLLSFAVVAAGAVGLRSFDTLSELNALQGERDALQHSAERARPRHRLSESERAQLRAEIADANGVVNQLHLPWNALFKDIEGSRQKQVALLSIVPDPGKQVVQISGEAKDLDAVVGYIRFLQKAGSLHAIYLQSHKVQVRSAQRPVRFTLNASWVLHP